MADEVNEVETAEIEQVSHRDDIANDVRAAMASLKGEGEAPEVEEEQTEETEAPQRERGPDGKFIAKDKSEAAPEQVAPEEVPPPAEDVAKPSAEQPSNAAGAAPVSWAADAKAMWSALPPAVQQAALKREAEVSAGFRQYSDQTRRYEQAIAPIAQEAQARGLTVEDGIRRLIDGQRFLEAQPAQAILWLAQRHGLDLAELASNPPAIQQQARHDPQFAQVHQTVSSLEQRLNSILMDQNMSVVEQFAQKNPYYGDVEEALPEIMSRLQAANPALTGASLLQEAYDLAVWKNPDIRGRMAQQQQEQAKQAAVAKVQEKSTKANKAAVSVKGSSTTAMPPKRQERSNGSVQDDVRDAIAQLRAS